MLMLSFIQIYVLPFNALLKVIPGQLTTPAWQSFLNALHPNRARNRTSCAKPDFIGLTELCDTPASCSDTARTSARFPVPDESGTNDMV